MMKKPSKNIRERSFDGVVRCVRASCIAILVATCSFNEVAAQDSIATPAIDESLFKDGAVEQKEATYDAWHLKCQQIVKMQRRFCNLLSTVVDREGKEIGSVLLATDDTGNPAMMIAFGWPLRLDKPLLISPASPPVTSKKKGNYEKAVRATQCDGSCKFLFPADSQLIVALNAGEDIVLKGYRARPLDGAPWFWPFAKTDAVELRIRGKGFAEALGASAEIW